MPFETCCVLDRPWPEHPGLRVEEWAEKFFGSLSVYVVSPLGLAGPYPFGHGEAQGESMGVGLFGAAGVMRTRFNGGVLRRGLTPSFVCHLRLNPLALYPVLPWSPSEICPEVVFSADRTLLSRGPEPRARGQLPKLLGGRWLGEQC